MRKALVLAGSVILLSLTMAAQESRSEFSLQGAGFFTNGTNSNGVDYSATESAGFLTTYRYHLNHWAAVEGAYGFSTDSQKYLLSSENFRIQSHIHQLTGSLVLNIPSRGHSRLNPYLLAGGGAMIFSPTGNQFNTLSGAQTESKGVFVYGVGMNYAIRKGIALRAEYRGLVYGTPTFGFGALSTNSVTQSAEPSIGISFRF